MLESPPETLLECLFGFSLLAAMIVGLRYSDTCLGKLLLGIVALFGVVTITFFSLYGFHLSYLFGG